MQNDEEAAKHLAPVVDDEKKKLWLQFLQRRQQFRNHYATQPANQKSTISAPSSTNPAHSPSKLPSAETNQQDEEPGTQKVQVNATGQQSELLIDPQAVDSETVIPLNGPPRPPSLPHLSKPHAAFGLVVVCSSFRHLPSFADKTKEIASQMFEALTDSHFARFSRRGSKLLLNPSVIEFQDAMKELQVLCATEDGASENASFFLCLSTHGARVTSGVNEGSYVLFSESRLSSEEELTLTAIHEHDLAKMIHAIPCKNKLLALELCQVKQAKEKPDGEAASIVNRIHESFSSRFYDQLGQLHLTEQRERNKHAGAPHALTEAQLLLHSAGMYNTVILDACVTKNEAPVRNREDNVSNFLHRLNDAFHGTTADFNLDEPESDPVAQSGRGQLHVKEVCSYVQRMVIQDAKQDNDLIKAEYTKHLRTKYEAVAAFQDNTQTPQLIGMGDVVDFTLGDHPAAPQLAPSPPQFVAATLSSITVAWNTGGLFVGFESTTSLEVPAILGFHLQIRGDGRAGNQWRRATGFQMLSFDQIVRKKTPPPTKVTVHGLACDMAFRFRLRARTAGGWGPFSEVSEAFHTTSYASTHSTFETVHAGFHKRGVHGVVELMKKHSANRDMQRRCIEFLARVVIKDPPRARLRPELRLVPGLDTPVVVLVCKAIKAFSHDCGLALHGCLFVGRLAQSTDAWRKCIVAIQDPCRVSELLGQVLELFAHNSTTNQETSSAALWASARLRGLSSRKRLAPDAAARRIQGLFRTRKAKEYLRTLATDIYSCMVDPTTGTSYFFNTRTGATSWTMPSFLT